MSRKSRSLSLSSKRAPRVYKIQSVQLGKESARFLVEKLRQQHFLAKYGSYPPVNKECAERNAFDKECRRKGRRGARVCGTPFFCARCDCYFEEGWSYLTQSGKRRFYVCVTCKSKTDANRNIDLLNISLQGGKAEGASRKL